MSYNPYIQRILIEQIQEFELLDLQELDPNDPNNKNKLFLIAYDIITRKFFHFTYDLMGGTGDIIINKAILSQNHIVNTDDLSVPRGFEFKSGWDLDAVVDALCNPPIPGTATLTASPYLIEINTNTPVDLQYTWTQRSEGNLVAGSEQYYRGNTPISTIPDLLISTTPGIITYKIEFNVTSTPAFPSSTKSATDTVKVIYPFLIGAGPLDTIGSIGSLNDHNIEALHDIGATGYMIAEFNRSDVVPPPAPGSQAPKNFYWFAIHQSFTPTSWVAIDSNGVEDSLNKGSIDTAFTDIGNLTFKGNSYKIYMGIQETYYSSRIKIKF